MKLLLDENLSFRLVASLADLYPGSSHVRLLDMLGADDDTVWNYAREHGFLIASKDIDFYQRSVLLGAPPKVIWLQVGNASTEAIADLLRANYVTIRRFHEEPAAAFLRLTTSA